jgi:ribosomal protein L40E
MKGCVRCGSKNIKDNKNGVPTCRTCHTEQPVPKEKAS